MISVFKSCESQEKKECITKTVHEDRQCIILWEHGGGPSSLIGKDDVQACLLKD